MRIRFNEEIGTLDIDGVLISASVLRELVNPDRRLLFRFERKNGTITCSAYSELQVLWLDREENITDQTTEFGAIKQESTEENRS